MQDWIELNLRFGVWYGDDEYEDSFCQRGLNKAGTLIETDEYGAQLIGNVNEKMGYCDCCADIFEDIVIKRYKVIWQKSTT